MQALQGHRYLLIGAKDLLKQCNFPPISSKTLTDTRCEAACFTLRVVYLKSSVLTDAQNIILIEIRCNGRYDLRGSSLDGALRGKACSNV